MTRKHTNMEELISHMFIMGRVMRDRVHKNGGIGQASLLEFETLKYVKDAGQPHMREVARNFHVTPPAATLLIDSLVKAKLLARVLDPKDRRSIRVSLTPRGRQLLERGITKKVNELKKMLSLLTPTERSQFVAILKKIINHNL